MRLNKKSISRVTLLDLLRRKQTTLVKFLEDNGIFTYDRLATRCSSLGVIPPSEEQFRTSMGNPSMHKYSSPTDGIIVLHPDPLNISDVETVGEPEAGESESSQSSSLEDETSNSVETTKRRKKKTSTQLQNP